ncbi:hepatocyte growth factor activator serine protease isoform X2 [Stigmatopora nigra]
MTQAFFLFLPLALCVPAVSERRDAAGNVGGKGGTSGLLFLPSPQVTISNQTDAKGPRVVTTGGQECALPFRQGGQIHHGCVRVLASRPWCSLTANFDRDRQWGFCAQEPGPPNGSRSAAGAVRPWRRAGHPCGCQNGGRCQATAAAAAECSCPAGFSGSFCQHQRCYESGHLRHYHAGQSWGRIHLRTVEQCTCVGGGGGGEVRCRPARYTACLSNPCQNQGRCRTIATTGESVCHCRRGYGGPRCSLEPESRCYEGRGAAYRGLASTAASGAPCLPWDSELLYDELHLGTVRHAALKGLGQHAYCRNPDGDQKPWCYTLSRSAISWEYCAVPPCKARVFSSRRTKAAKAKATCGKKHKKRPPAAVRGRIMGGSAALPGAHPWMAAIYIGGDDFCAGTLIASCWVLSAAHCFFRNPPKRDVRVVLGQHLFNVSGPESRSFAVDKYVLPKRFSVFNPTRHDIVLVKLKKQNGRCVKRTPFVGPICLPDGGVAFPDGYCCSISGWGHVHEGDNRYSNLREAGVRLIRHEDCRKPEVYGDHVTGDMICAGIRGCVDACQGDSGGPLACAKDGVHFLYGIVSWGDKCEASGKPGVYTKVANYVDWINSVIRRTAPKT